MTSRDFCYWLQGYFEIRSIETGLSKEQAEMIQKHLQLVFIHEIDASYGDKPQQDKLNAAHNDPLSGRPNGARC